MPTSQGVCVCVRIVYSVWLKISTVWFPDDMGGVKVRHAIPKSRAASEHGGKGWLGHNRES